MEPTASRPQTPPSESACQAACPWRYAVCPYLGKRGMVYEPMGIDLSRGAADARAQLLKKLNGILGREESRLEDLYGFVDYRYAGTRCSKPRMAFTLKDFTSETTVLVYPSGKTSLKRLRQQERVLRVKDERKPTGSPARAPDPGRGGSTASEEDCEYQRLAKECQESMDPRRALPPFFWPMVARENLQHGIHDVREVVLSADMLKIYASYVEAAVFPGLGPAAPSASSRRVGVFLSVHPACVGRLECAAREWSAECDQDDVVAPQPNPQRPEHPGRPEGESDPPQSCDAANGKVSALSSELSATDAPGARSSPGAGEKGALHPSPALGLGDSNMAA